MKRRVAVDADDIKIVLIDQLGQRDILRRRFIRLKGDADLACVHVRSSLSITRRLIRSIFIMRRSSGSGQATSESRSSRSLAASPGCLPGAGGSTALRA